MWPLVAIALIAVGGITAAYGAPPEGIGAPTALTMVGIGLTIAGVGVAGWRVVIAIAGVE